VVLLLLGVCLMRLSAPVGRHLSSSSSGPHWSSRHSSYLQHEQSYTYRTQQQQQQQQGRSGVECGTHSTASSRVRRVRG